MSGLTHSPSITGSIEPLQSVLQGEGCRHSQHTNPLSLPHWSFNYWHQVTRELLAAATNRPLPYMQVQQIEPLWSVQKTYLDAELPEGRMHPSASFGQVRMRGQVPEQLAINSDLNALPFGPSSFLGWAPWESFRVMPVNISSIAAHCR